MHRNDEHHDDELIDLGKATELTKGGHVISNDSGGQQQGLPGLHDD